MDIFTDISSIRSLWLLIPPMILLPVVMIGCAVIYKILLGNILPKKIYNFLLGPIALLGFFIWVIPMNMGFYEFFRAML